MSVKDIRLFGDPILRTAAVPVVDFDRELRQLVQDLTDTMLAAPGAGLAAPQIGVGLRVFTYHVDGVVGHLVNPTLRLSEERQEGPEGCLSFPGLVLDTPRALSVVATGYDQHGEPLVIEGSDLLARALQHETDHLDGILFIDRMDPQQRKAAMKAIREAEWNGGPVPTRQAQPALDVRQGDVAMRLVFAGTPAVAVPSLDALVGSRHELVGVVTRPDAPAGRGRAHTKSPVRARAEQHGIPVLAPRTPRDPEFQRQLRELAPDCCAVVAYGALVPRAALDIPRHGWVNLHFSLLPAWRGAAPVQHAIMAGDEVTGATTFRIEEALDTGPVYGVMTEPIRPTDTSGELLARLAVAGAQLLLATLDGIAEGTLVARPQPPEGVSHAPKVEVDDARVRWERPAAVIDRQVRGCSPAPGAWTTFRGDRLKLGPVALCEAAAGPGPIAPGALVVTKQAVYAGTGTSPVQLGLVQAHGKRPMPAADWARGVRIGSGEGLGEGHA